MPERKIIDDAEILWPWLRSLWSRSWTPEHRPSRLENSSGIYALGWATNAPDIVRDKALNHTSGDALILDVQQSLPWIQFSNRARWLMYEGLQLEVYSNYSKDEVCKWMESQLAL